MKGRAVLPRTNLNILIRQPSAVVLPVLHIGAETCSTGLDEGEIQIWCGQLTHCSEILT